MVDLFLIQSYTMVASPSLKECPIVMLEDEVEGKASVCERPGLRGKSGRVPLLPSACGGNRDAKMERPTLPK